MEKFVASNKTALITGITGQDGSYLAELLLDKGYEVHGIKRRSSSFNTGRIDHLYEDPHSKDTKFKLHFGDITDSSNLMRIIEKSQPDEIYNLAAQSHVQVSFESPEYTANADAIGVVRILEAIRILELTRTTKFYQASSSEMFGISDTKKPLNELSSFYPRSPYAVSKLFGHWTTINYREAYDMFAVSGILFNHESPRRGETFVTRKIVKAAVAIKNNLQECLYLGNLEAMRDWGHAKDYVDGMWRMLQAPKAEDYVLATGVTTSVRDFCERVFAELGLSIKWQGKGINEVGVMNDKVIIRVDPNYFRPTEVPFLWGDSTKAFNELGWKPVYDLDRLIKEMVEQENKNLNEKYK